MTPKNRNSETLNCLKRKFLRPGRQEPPNRFEQVLSLLNSELVDGHFYLLNIVVSHGARERNGINELKTGILNS